MLKRIFEVMGDKSLEGLAKQLNDLDENTEVLFVRYAGPLYYEALVRRVAWVPEKK